MKKVWVTSCSQSQGWPISRVTMSNITVVEKPNSSRPQSIIRIISSTSNARHLRCRCRLRTSFSAIFSEKRIGYREKGKTRRGRHSRPLHAIRQSFSGADQILDLDRMRAKLLGKLVLQRSGDLDETRLVDIGHDLDADRFQLVRRLMLELDSLGGLILTDLIRCCGHPLLLVIGQALPRLIAYPYSIDIGLMLGH